MSSCDKYLLELRHPIIPPADPNYPAPDYGDALSFGVAKVEHPAPYFWLILTLVDSYLRTHFKFDDNRVSYLEKIKPMIAVLYQSILMVPTDVYTVHRHLYASFVDLNLGIQDLYENETTITSSTFFEDMIRTLDDSIFNLVIFTREQFDVCEIRSRYNLMKKTF